jgi:multiple sugar transport system substrate-binding protein
MDNHEERTNSPVRVTRITRRRALKLLGIGVGGSALLAACGSAATNTPAPPAATTAPATSATTAAATGATTAPAVRPTTAAVITAKGKVVMATGRDVTGTVKKIIDDFNKLNNGITIEYQELEADSSANKNKYTTVFAAKDSSIDVIAADIPWVPEFGAAGWVAPLDKYVDAGFRGQFFDGTLQGATFKEKLYGIPWYINSGVLYYRKDLLDAAGLKPPTTFAELEKQAAQLQKDGLYGFAHHGFQNEGLSAVWLEILWGYGGEYWDSKTAEVTVGKTDAGEKSLQWWLDNINTRKITPTQVTSWKGPDAHNTFNQGNAVFLRAWFDVYAQTQGAESKVKDKVGVAPMVAAEGQKAPSCLGNWFMAVSNFSKNPDAAWEVVKYMTGVEASKARTIGTGAPPGNKLAYSDKEILEKYPHYTTFTKILETAKPRPVTPAYNQISAEVIQVQVANALSGKATPKAAIQAMVEKSAPLLAQFK